MLADLDELVLRVRNPESRRNIEESVRVLRAGSPRAAIMLTWLAIVNDVVGKLRELEDGGDAQAKRLREEFEEIRQKGDIRGAQDFEARIAQIALQLELVSKVEQEDLQRIQNDRHRCAHPSQTDDGVPYSPSDELGRTHIRVAVESLLQFPPAQGKAALTRVQAEIDSQYFPDELDAAVGRLRASALGRGRRSLIRNAAIAFVKALLDEPRTDLSTRRRLALAALWHLHPAILDELAVEKFRSLCAAVDDSLLGNLLFLLRFTPRIRASLPPETSDRLRRYVEKPPPNEERYVTVSALSFEEYREVAITRLLTFPIADYNWVLGTAGKTLPIEAGRALVVKLLASFEALAETFHIERLHYVAHLMTPPEIRRFFNATMNGLDPVVDHSSELFPVVSKFDPVIAEQEFRLSDAAGHYVWEDMLETPF